MHLPVLVQPDTPRPPIGRKDGACCACFRAHVADGLAVCCGQ